MKFKVGDKVKFKEGNKRFVSQKQGVITSISSNDHLRFEGDKNGWHEVFYEIDMENKKNKTTNTINTYFRDKNGNKEGQVKAMLWGGKIVVRYHFCDTRYDKFVKNFPMNMFRGDFSVIPYRHRESFKEFLERAKRYFQGTRCFDWEKTDLKEEHNQKNSPPFKVGDKVRWKKGSVNENNKTRCGVITSISHDGHLRFNGDSVGWHGKNYELDIDETKEVPNFVFIREDEHEVIFKLIIPKEYHNKKLIFRYDY